MAEPLLEYITQSSQAFFSTFTAIFSAVFLAVRALETLKHFPAKTQDYEHLKGIATLAAIATFASSLPLVFAELSNCIAISSALFLVAALVVFIQFCEQLRRGVIEFKYRISYHLMWLSLPFFLLLGMNTARFFYGDLYFNNYQAAVAYKIPIVWMMVLLGFRVYLVIGYLLVPKRPRPSIAKSKINARKSRLPKEK